MRPREPYCWLQEAQRLSPGRSYLDDANAPTVLPTKEGAGRGPRYAPEAPPPRGERNRKLVEDGCIVAAREERLLDIWCRKEELLQIDAPILGTLKRAALTRTARRYCSSGGRAPLP